MKCLACGDHPLNYIHCDRWDCPLLVVRAKIEGVMAVLEGRITSSSTTRMPDFDHMPEMDYRQAVREIFGGVPEQYPRLFGGEQEPLGKEFERVLHENLWALYERSMPEEERDHEPPDEDDDEIAVDWDENGYWPSENDDTQEDEE